MASSHRVLPVLAVLLAAFFGASSGLYIKGVALSSLALAGFRMGVPFLVLLPLIVRGRRLLGPPEGRRNLWIASGINAVRMILFIMAYKLTSLGNAVVLLYLWPIFALLFDCFRLRRPPAPAQIGLLFLASAGVATMNMHRRFSLSSADLMGSAFMIASAALFAATAIIFKKALETVKETDAMYFQNALGALVFLPILALEFPRASAADLGWGLVYGASVGLVGFGLFFFAMKRLPLFQYSALAYSEVPIGVALGATVFGEVVKLNQVAGAAMIVVASFLAQRLRARG